MISIHKNLKAILWGLFTSVLFLGFTGITTVVIPNSRYMRMTSIGWWEYSVYGLTGILVGVFVGLYVYNRKYSTACTNGAAGGVMFGVLTYGCSTCNALLLAVLGTTGVLTYFEPVRPWLGLLGIVLLIASIWYQLKK